ncbi:hypothetical protein QQF64_034768, partial [Cirrhinus molitorella]
GEGEGFQTTVTPIEVNLQKALAEASETCTQECLILGHSDSCWMPPALTQFQTSGAATLPSFGFQQSWARGTKPDGRHTLGSQLFRHVQPPDVRRRRLFRLPARASAVEAR